MWLQIKETPPYTLEMINNIAVKDTKVNLVEVYERSKLLTTTRNTDYFG